MGSVDYSKRTDNKESFSRNVFKLFTDQCGGTSQEFADLLYQKYTIEDFAYHDDVYYWGVFEYFTKVVIPHKIAVYQAGVELSRLDFNQTRIKVDKDEFLRNIWLHDASKFSANEAFGYTFYNRKTGSGKEGFELAWHHHKMHNPHHPEYWLNPSRTGDLEVLPMPDIYVLEMIADWMGAGKTYGSSLEEWLPDNLFKFKWHPKTAVSVSRILKLIGIDTTFVDINDDTKIKIGSAKFPVSI